MQLWIALLPEFTSPNAQNLYEAGFTRVDDASRLKILKFYRRPDAWRCLLGRLLPRQLLKQQGVSDARNIQFGASSSGKPYIASPSSPVSQSIAYNVSHDNGLIAMAYALDAQHHSDIGVDIMRVSLPRGQSNTSFIEILTDQLSKSEIHTLRDPSSSPSLTLHRIFLLWTLKEAYTKTLGLGLGFDFSRISYDFETERVLIDGVSPKGFKFVLFEIEKDAEIYQGVMVRKIGGESESTLMKHKRIQVHEGTSWIKFWEAEELINACDVIQE